ncbi:class I SAM-dependent methyltransferase [Prauserella cavernicola]|uniref:Class I SAM-dependent methyltransferase n=1 Tax=Prauserella cavernicola TaxID=2800127 RepID=A0A934QWY8_9PSEU|nr:class I SAM-dependent methyltransferase [Prauserella cavernicola]MBK1787998.1 class I SAM-dependent methyltransferase [Prauserella cavernicola]
MYQREVAEVYELIHGYRGKDWVDEAKTVIAESVRRQPAATSLLDVACGTGAHLATFSECFDEVHGMDCAEPMLEHARRRLPDAVMHRADMRDFELGRRFDVVCCLFASIAYLRNVAELNAAVAGMVRHLNPGGVVVIEPWFCPEQAVDGYIAADLYREDDVAIGRFSHSVRRGSFVQMDVRFVRTDRAGIDEFSERHELRLFALDEYLGALTSAGCTVERVDGVLPRSASGLLIGVRE